VSTWLCKTCATQYPESDEPPAACPICEDPRQYVKHDDGQVWVRYEDFLAGHDAEVRGEAGVLGIGCNPSFAIGQRALLVKSAAGNLLWDCIPYVDDALVERVGAEGGLAGIAVSHPHFHSAMVEWAHAFGCPVHLHESVRKHVVRPDAAIRYWQGDSFELGGGLTLVRCGGHFDGSQVLHWRDGRALFTADTVMVVADRGFVSFMYSYPNLIPLPPSKVRHIADALAPFEFDSIYGAWWDAVIERDGSAIVRRSVDRYIRAVTEPGLPA
jgi:glyoxylase-like metal-dependent hydrolase (beta-lactamase superfamily II)